VEVWPQSRLLLILAARVSAPAALLVVARPRLGGGGRIPLRPLVLAGLLALAIARRPLNINTSTT